MSWTGTAVSGSESDTGFLPSGGDPGEVLTVGGDGQLEWKNQSATPDDGASVEVESFGALGAPTDDSAAIQAAINTGKDVIFAPRQYVASGLTQTADDQHFVCPKGKAQIFKSANGTLFASTGDRVQLRNLEFYGVLPGVSAYTGDNLTFAGDDCALLNCSSRNCSGRPVKATGGHFQIIGTCGCYNTTDASATGYDIELGIAGTATLYHHIVGVYTSHSAGGILLTDVGVGMIACSQFGKLSIKKSTGPAGSGGGTITGCRITGTVTVEMSGVTFAVNQFSGGPIAFVLGSAGCSFNASNTLAAGCVVTNAGNANNLIEANVSAGSYTQLKYGATAQRGMMQVDHSSGEFKFAQLAVEDIGQVIVPINSNSGGAGAVNAGIEIRNNGILQWQMLKSSGNDLTFNVYDAAGTLVAQPINITPGGNTTIASQLTRSGGVTYLVGSAGNTLAVQADGNVEVLFAGTGMILKTPDGTKRYKITVNNAGAITATLI